jgi:SOS-response transcriptional repressor LexA
MEGAFSWNSELPSGHSPFWIRDEALSALNLHRGDAVSVDTRSDPRDGDLVVVEVEVNGDSQRLARRYFSAGDQVRLEPVGEADYVGETFDVDADAVIVMGVIVGRLRFATDAAPVEEPLSL